MVIPLLLAVIFSATAIVVALAMLFLVLWQAARRRGNQLMALYMASVIGWSISSLAIRLSVLFAENPVPFFVGLLHSVALNGLVLCALTAYYADRWRFARVRLILAAGLLYYLAILPLGFAHELANRFALTPEGTYYYRFDLLGAVNFALILGFYTASLVILWRFRQGRAGSLLPGAAAVSVGVLTTLVPGLSLYSVPLVGAALSAVLFARAILRRDLFNPLAELNRQLADNERRLRTVIAGAPVVLFALDGQGVFTLIEGRGLEALGIKPTDVVGRSVFDPQARLPQVVEAVQRALAGETSTGTVEIGSRVLEARYSPIRSDNGEVIGVIGVSTDITDRNLAQAAVGHHIHQLELLQRIEVELTQKLNIDYVLSMGLDVTVRLSRAEAACIALAEGDGVRIAQVIGYYPESVVGLYLPPDKGIIGRGVRCRQAEVVLDVTQDPDYITVIPETQSQMVIPLMSQDRLIGILCLETAVPQRFTEDRFEFLKLLTGRIAAAIDNAQLYQQSQEQLAELRGLYAKVSALEQLKTTMIRIAAHDLRNPIGLVSGYLQLLREELRPHLSGSSEQFFEGIERAAERMDLITNGILSLQRIEQAAEGNQQEKIALNTMVEQVYDDHQAQAQQKTQDFKLDLPGDPLVVWGDRSLLHEAIVNLVANAIKYTPEGGGIQVRLKREDGAALFEVEDSGYGVPEDQQGRLFEPFFRAKTDETSSITGTGLGLHLVKTIIERHQGQMRFHSVYGQGSTFGFWLPLWQEGT